MRKRLNFLKPDEKRVRHIRRKAGCHRITAAVLANRGVLEDKDIHEYFNPTFSSIHNGFSMIDMERAVRRIHRALSNRERILIFGDYDVDGITSTTLLREFLTAIGADVRYYIPHRIEEGYGLKPFHIANVVKKNDIHLIITVDCGSGSYEAVLEANRLGIDTIITDHHAVSDPPPPAAAVVNPQRRDCTAGVECLAGVGVAFLLLVCLRKHLREAGYWSDGEEPNLKSLCDLVALGTVADIVPLINENRVLTKIGLEVINKNPRPGIRALIQASGIRKPFISAEDIAFRLAPRLNAAGRMDHANLGVRLLEAADFEEAKDLAESVSRLNTQRQNIENQVLKRIGMYLEEKPQLLSRKSMVLASDDWHEGVLGIVASRLARSYWRPVVLLTFKNGMGKGSARSIPSIDLYRAISACDSCLSGFGGHPMAAGLSMAPGHLEAFREAFESAVSEMAPTEAFEPFLDIDYELKLDMISNGLLDELESLQPFGPENEEPLFCATDVDIVHTRAIGQGHRRFILKQRHAKSQRPVEGIWFHMPEAYQASERFSHLVFKLRWNYWNGDKRVQLMIEEAAMQ